MVQLSSNQSPGTVKPGFVFASLLFIASLFLLFTPTSAQPGGSLIASCPGNIVKNNDPGQCGAVTTFAAIPVTGKNVTIVYSRQPGALFPVGSTDVVVTAYDNNGFSSTCTFNVTIVDNEAPKFGTFQAQHNVVAENGKCGAVVNYAKPTVTQNCTYVSKSFSYTGGAQTFTVPAGVHSLKVDLTGAAGGKAGSYDGYAYGYPGHGGRVEATIPVTPGQVLTFHLGGAGQNGSATAGGAGGYNGGGNGANVPDDYSGGGGGGASDIRIGNGTLNDRIVVAGGGGGTGYNGEGGYGGGLTSLPGVGAGSSATGGSQTTGGSGAVFSSFAGENGSFGKGGNGAEGVQSGGGGAGWYGGGGGSFGDGAGGSSYTLAGATNISHTAGYQEGNGAITFIWAPPTSYVQTTGLPSGSLFPVGETVNTFVATDHYGNSSQVDIKVIVTETQKPTLTVPANLTVSAEVGKCGASVSIGSAVAADNCTIASVTNDAPVDGVFPVGTTTITWKAIDANGNETVAVQTVTVTDDQKPVLTVPANQVFNNPKDLYSIPSLIATDNCGIASATYTVTGATTKSGNKDASGPFNPGTSYINWVVTDIHGNTENATTVVDIKIPQSLVIHMDDVWTVAPYGSPNTIYLGLGPTSMNLKATPTSGTAPYTFEWKKAGNATVLSNTDNLEVTSEGDYVVNITDYNGNTGSLSRRVNMLDVRCGNGGDKVAICHIPLGNPSNAKTICVSKNAVPSFLVKDSYVGNCTQGRGVRPVATEAPIVKASVYPNPTTDKLNVQLSNKLGAKAEIIVINSNGMIVVKKNVEVTSASQLLQINIGKFAPGAYMIKIKTEQGVKTEKVILVR